MERSNSSARAGRRRRLLTDANTLLAERYGTPLLGNKRNPISELVFIILSARTRGVRHEAVYKALRRRFPTWETVRDARVRLIEAVIHDNGLGRIKTLQIKKLLQRLSVDFGDLSARHLTAMSTEDLESYLTTLPGVGLKTARCVIMYSLDRPVFPVDTHCMRLFQNLGILKQRLRFEFAQDILQDMVPPEIRRSLHVNAVAHGRSTCLPVGPRCGDCPIIRLCVNPVAKRVTRDKGVS